MKKNIYVIELFKRENNKDTIVAISQEAYLSLNDAIKFIERRSDFSNCKKIEEFVWINNNNLGYKIKFLYGVE